MALLSMKFQIVAVLVVLLAACSIAIAAAAPEAAGNWVGPLEVTPGTYAPLAVHIERDEAGALRGTFSSPLQGVRNLPLAGINAGMGSLAFTVPGIGGSFRGQWDEESKLWKGKWSQAGVRRPLSFQVPPPPLSAQWQLPPDVEIAKLIADRNAQRPGQGIVIGVLGPEGPRFVGGGTGAGAKVDRSSLFGIGSISKVFTALILADMVNKGEVSLDDPAEKYLPAGHHMPQRGGRQITLRDLATHHSGLPRMADDMRRVDSRDGPFVDYSETKLLAFLDRYQLPRDIGSKWEYSNLGVGLLGYLLARAAHTDYETLLRQRVTGPLGMNDTLITLPPSHAARLAAPFDAYMSPTKPWNSGLFAGAGGIRSSAADMLIFAKAVLDPNSPIAAAVKTTLSVRVSGIPPSVDQALGWQVMHLSANHELLMHDGRTRGFQSDLLLDPAKGRAVVALTNSEAQPAPDDIALHILVGTQVSPTPRLLQAPPPLNKLFLVVLALSIGVATSAVRRAAHQCRRPSDRAGRQALLRMNASHAAVTQWGLGHVAIEEDFTILDIGCGGGQTIDRLASRTRGKVCGVDYSEVSVATARKVNERAIAEGRVDIQQASVSQLPFPDATFDLAIAVETHYYWPDLPRDVREAKRVIKRGGRFLIIAETYRGRRNDWLYRPMMTLVLRAAYLRPDAHRQLLVDAGYADVQVFCERSQGWICAMGTCV